MAIWTWSTIAASNSNSDQNINWAEGMSPSAVNDSARSMMAALAGYRNDTALLTLGGGPTAYTVATTQGAMTTPTASNCSLRIMIPVANPTNGANPTLAVDGGFGFPLQQAAGTALNAGYMIPGTPYDVSFFNNAWLVEGVAAPPTSVPVGAMMSYGGASAPSSQWALCFGQSLNSVANTQYAGLFTAIGTNFGGTGASAFNLPDLRGRIPAGQDNMGGGAAGRIGAALVTDSGTINGQSIGSAGGSQSHTQVGAEVGSHTHAHTISASDSGHTHTISPSGDFSIVGVGGSGPAAAGSGTTSAHNTQSSSAAITTTGSITANVTSAGMAWLQPTVITTWIIRVT